MSKRKVDAMQMPHVWQLFDLRAPSPHRQALATATSIISCSS
eukprot:CAMPEP_0182531974 /NCGR_PEP_ID=MMETSP1323-20130603/10332_1 /TAXON_ID=236787 /ORGANISM="Florenciella parvula, Strain RCC1693" /LENGTH=41 /DNA_ID= /DNA_START= /DNA_END= /DNA_ORIENTATION=